MSGGRASTGTIAANSSWSWPRERETARLAILEAARRLVDQHGPSDLTLSAVASEAGIARTTIYGYFAGKQDLLSQLSGEAPPQQAWRAADSHRVAETPVEAPPDEVMLKPADADAICHDERAEAGEQVKSENKTADLPNAADSHGEAMRLQAEELDKLAKRIIVPKAAMREGTDVVISRLETRVKVIEQSVANLEARHANDAKETSGRIEAATAAVQQLQKRLEAMDNRQQYALAALRLDVHNLANPKNTATAQSAVSPEGSTAERQATFTPGVVVPVVSEPASISSPTEEASSSYLSAARRAAREAAQMKAVDERRDGTALRRTVLRRQLALLALIAAGFAAFLLMRIDGVPRARANSDSTTSTLADRSLSRRPGGKIDAKASASDTLAALAAAGNEQAQLLLGLKLFNGDGVAINIEKGTNLLTRAAARGQPIAQCFLAVLFQTGTGVAADMAQAVRWYEAAAQQGNVKAMTDLAKAYAGGWKQGVDFAAAARWFASAANYGDVDAQFDLAVLFERGTGVPNSIRDAYTWYSIAAAQGDKAAAARAKAIASELSLVELRAADAAAASFKPLIPKPAANELPSAAMLLAQHG